MINDSAMLPNFYLEILEILTGYFSLILSHSFNHEIVYYYQKCTDEETVVQKDEVPFPRSCA